MLKRDGICPSCDGRVFWRIEEIKDIQGSTSHPIPAVVMTGWLGTKRAVGGFETFICKACGLTEFYAHGLDQLEAHPEEGILLVNNEPEAGLR